MNKVFKEIAKFNLDAGTELCRHWLPEDEIENEVRMLDEELGELDEAFVNKSRVEVADALGDIIVVAVGTASKLGIDIERVLCDIIESNKSKYVDGKLIKNEEGKIQKGENFFQPDLEYCDDVYLVSEDFIEGL
jgi:predicted HAD superfamily Cof-like phosphohydrolase